MESKSDKIEALASLLKCPLHNKHMKACMYQDGEHCKCRLIFEGSYEENL